MVTLDELAALDAVLWQRNGKLASQALRCNQSTVSRRLTRTLDSFQLTMTRRHGEWQVLGNPLLLQMERELHQLCRLLGSHPLRLEFSPYCGPMLARCLSKDWVVGTMDHLGQARPLALLEERVIDAYLTESSLDLPAPEDPTWTVIPLWRLPRGPGGPSRPSPGGGDGAESPGSAAVPGSPLAGLGLSRGE